MRFKDTLNEAVYEVDNMWNADRGKQWVSITSPKTGKKLTIHVRDWDKISYYTKRDILDIIHYKMKKNAKTNIELSKEEAELFVTAVKEIEDKNNEK